MVDLHRESNEHDAPSLDDLLAATRRAAQCTLDIGANRVELLMVEVQEERERLLRSLHYGLAAASFGVLAGFSLTFAVAVLFWDHGAVLALFITAGVCAATTWFLCHRISALQRDYSMFAATTAQLRKDRECLGSMR